MPFRNHFFLAILPTLILFIACDHKDPLSGDEAADKVALLVGSKWKPLSHTISPAVDYEGDGALVTNLFAVEGGCSHDDILEFSASGSWSSDEGAAKCDDGDPQTETGNWGINYTQDSVFMISGLDGVFIQGKIVTLTSSRFSIALASDDWGDDKAHEEILTWAAVKP